MELSYSVGGCRRTVLVRAKTQEDRFVLHNKDICLKSNKLENLLESFRAYVSLWAMGCFLRLYGY